MRGHLIGLSLGLSLALLGAPARAQDVWSSPAPGVRLLRREHRGVVLQVATANLGAPELRPSTVALDESERDPVVAATEHDAFVGLAASDARVLVPAARALLAGNAPAGVALGPEAVWGAVGVTEANVLVLLSAERGRAPAAVAEETLRSLGVVRAVAVRGERAASLLVRGRPVHPGGARADALIAVRLLPGAEPAHREPVVAPMASSSQTAPAVAAVMTLRPERVPPPVVQVAGVTAGHDGPPGVAWLALSVLGCLSVALGRRARVDE